MSPGLASPTAERWRRGATVLLLSYFVLRALYLAFETPHSFPPDEIEHFGRSALFSTALLPPADSPDSYRFGLLSQRPYLYHWLMGRLLSLNPFPDQALLFLRLANVALAALTVLVANGAMAFFSANPVVRVLFLVMLTNTLMFTFLSATVNYDNLVNLLAAMAFYSLFAYCRRRRPGELVALAVCALAGILTKASFLPLALLLLVVVVWHERRALPEVVSRLWGWLRAPRPGRIALIAVALVLLLANLRLYGGNLWLYGSAIPDCRRVLELEACLERPNFARSWILEVYRSGQLSLEDALQAASGVQHPQLRGAARYLVRNYQSWTERGKPLVDRFHYGFHWVEMMLKGATGILGHASMSHPSWQRAPYVLLLLAAGLSLARYWRPGDGARSVGYSLFVVVCYAFILMQLVNYPSYARTGSMTLAVQGRYLFPLLVPGTALVARYLIDPLPRPLQMALAALIAGLFLSGDLPFYLATRTPAWVGGP